MSVQGKYISGEGATAPYCPSAAKSAGDVVAFSAVGQEMISMVTRDLAAEEIGSIYISGIWNLPLAASHDAIEIGTDMYWDEDGNPDEAGLTAGTGALTETSTGNIYVGKAVLPDRLTTTSASKAASATDERCNVWVCNGNHYASGS